MTPEELREMGLSAAALAKFRSAAGHVSTPVFDDALAELLARLATVTAERDYAVGQLEIERAERNTAAERIQSVTAERDRYRGALWKASVQRAREIGGLFHSDDPATYEEEWLAAVDAERSDHAEH